MAKPLVSDVLWAKIEPLLPRNDRDPKGAGRPGPYSVVSPFVLRTGDPQEVLPAELSAARG